MKEGEQRPAAAGGRKRRGAVSAAVEKCKEQRKPAAFFGHRKVREPSFKTPLRCTDLKDFGLRTLFLAGAAVAAPVFCTRSDHISRGGGCRPCGEGCSETRPKKTAQRQGGSKEGRSPLLCRFKEGVQGRGNRNPLPWRAFSFCPLSLCTSKEKMDTNQPGQHDQRWPPRAAACRRPFLTARKRPRLCFVKHLPICHRGR